MRRPGADTPTEAGRSVQPAANGSQQEDGPPPWREEATRMTIPRERSCDCGSPREPRAEGPGSVLPAQRPTGRGPSPAAGEQRGAEEESKGGRQFRAAGPR